MRAFFINGRNIQFRISSGAYIEGEYAPYAPWLDKSLLDQTIQTIITVILQKNVDFFGSFNRSTSFGYNFNRILEQNS